MLKKRKAFRIKREEYKGKRYNVNFTDGEGNIYWEITIPQHYVKNGLFRKKIKESKRVIKLSRREVEGMRERNKRIRELCKGEDKVNEVEKKC